MLNSISDILPYVLSLLPAAIVGFVANNLFKSHFSNENKRRNFLLHKENMKETLPLRLQAYERMVLFLERIEPHKLLLRVKPYTEDVTDYVNLLAENINQEFEHNLTQQIYISQEAWQMIQTSKNTYIQIIRTLGMQHKDESPNKFREILMKEFMNEAAPTQQAIIYIKEEVSSLW